MITRGCLFLALMVNYVLSLPVSSHHTENADVKVMKCIVEVIADALSKPDPTPVSQGCLHTLRTDPRLVSILRRQNFLKELQEIALQGANDRALKPEEGGASGVTNRPGGSTALKYSPDQSMLTALEGPGEKTALPEKRESEDHSVESEGESQEEQPDRRFSNFLNEAKVTQANMEDGAEKEENGRERNVVDDTRDISGGETELAKTPAAVKPLGAKLGSEGVQKAAEGWRDSERPDERKREEEEKEEEREEEKLFKHRGETGKVSQGIPHHSKEEEDGGGEKQEEREEQARRSPAAQELQMMARREPEEGSAHRRAEDDEVESLAAIESELESMAQKLHELRRG